MTKNKTTNKNVAKRDHRVSVKEADASVQHTKPRLKQSKSGPVTKKTNIIDTTDVFYYMDRMEEAEGESEAVAKMVSVNGAASYFVRQSKDGGLFDVVNEKNYQDQPWLKVSRTSFTNYCEFLTNHRLNYLDRASAER